MGHPYFVDMTRGFRSWLLPVVLAHFRRGTCVIVFLDGGGRTVSFEKG